MNWPAVPFRGREICLARAGVDQDQLAAGVDDNRREGVVEDVAVLVCGCQRGFDLFFLHIGHEIFQKFPAVDAIGHDGDLDVADLVAIKTGRLLAGRGRGGVCAGAGRDGEGGSGCGTGKQAATRE